MVLVNMAGYYDWVNTWFMGNFVFKFLAKISYVGYLIHWSIILIVLSIFYEGSSTSLVIFIQYFVMVTLLTVVAGTIIHLLVEAPFGNLVGRLK